MKRITLSLLSLQLLAGLLMAADVAVNIGETSLTIPTPRGYVPVTKEMAALDRDLEDFVAPQNTRLVSFIPEQYLPAVQRGEIPAMARTVSVQTNKKTVPSTITSSEFARFKDIVRRQNDELIQKAEKEMPGLMDKASKKINDQFNTDLTMNLSSMVPFPPHDESDRSLSFSMLLHYSIKNAAGRSTNGVGYVTTTFLHARGKLFSSTSTATGRTWTGRGSFQKTGPPPF
jgi:hypothetical protein